MSLTSSTVKSCHGGHLHTQYMLMCFHGFYNCEVTVTIISGAVTVLHTHTDLSVVINDSPSLCLWCTVTDKRLLNIAVSIFCLCLFSAHRPLLHSLLPHRQLKTTHSLWIGQEAERIVAKCLSLTFRLFCSLHKQIKPSFSQSACLSHRHSVASHQS